MECALIGGHVIIQLTRLNLLCILMSVKTSHKDRFKQNLAITPYDRPCSFVVFYFEKGTTEKEDCSSSVLTIKANIFL